MLLGKQKKNNFSASFQIFLFKFFFFIYAYEKENSTDEPKFYSNGGRMFCEFSVSVISDVLFNAIICYCISEFDANTL